MGLLTYCFYKNRTFRSRDNSKVPATTIVSREKVHILQALRGYWSLYVFHFLHNYYSDHVTNDFFFPFPHNTKGLLCLRKNKKHAGTDVKFSLKTNTRHHTHVVFFPLLSILLLGFKNPNKADLTKTSFTPICACSHTITQLCVSVNVYRTWTPPKPCGNRIKSTSQVTNWTRIGRKYTVVLSGDVD